MDLSRQIFKAFKSKGLVLSADASRALTRVLVAEPDIPGSLELVLTEIRSRIEKREIASSVIDVETITSIVADLSSSVEDLTHESTELLDAYSYPRIEYDEHQKCYKLNTKPSYNLYGSVDSRSNMFRERLLLTQQRLLRSGLFIQRGIKSNASNNKEVHELSTIASLLGSSDSNKVLLGMITQPEEGVWFLEDLGASVALDLSHATQYHYRLFTEGSLVIVEGKLVSQNLFKVEGIGFPPPEERQIALSAMGMVDTFGNDTRIEQLLQLRELEEESVKTLFIIMSDVQLDNPAVLEKLRVVFEGYETSHESSSSSPMLFVLMGSFIGRPLRSSGGRAHAVAAFAALADILANCPILQNHAKFVLIPGPLDEAADRSLPRRGISPLLTAALTDTVKHMSFASNPCRIRFYTQDILFFRENLFKKLQRHCVLPLPPDTQDSHQAFDIKKVLVDSVVDQAHLLPLPLTVAPVYWELDHTLRLTPLPHLMVLADRLEAYEYEYKGCVVINPGSFATNHSFAVYRPAIQRVELCVVP